MAKPPIEMMLDDVVWTPVAKSPEAETRGLPYVTFESVLELGGFQLRCYVLSTGQRIFDAEDVHKFFAALSDE